MTKKQIALAKMTFIDDMMNAYAQQFNIDECNPDETYEKLMDISVEISEEAAQHIVKLRDEVKRNKALASMPVDASLFM